MNTRKAATPKRSRVASLVRDEQLVLSKLDAIELMTYLVASAECCTREPLYYGTFRLLDGASRLAGYILDCQTNHRDAWMAEFKAEIDEKKAWMMSDRESYVRFVRQAAGTVADQLSRLAPVRRSSGRL